MLQSDKKFYRGGGISALNHIPLTPNLHILDLGCAAGAMGATIKRRQKDRVVGITASQLECDQAKDAIDSCILFDLENGLPDLGGEKFDVVIMSHLLEHICYPEKLLDDLRKVLKDSGIVVVVIPNIMQYKSRIKLLLGSFEYTNSHSRYGKNINKNKSI